MAKIFINGKEVDRRSVVMADVDGRDYPDFSDAYVESAEFKDGTPLTETELEELTESEGCELAHESSH